MESLTLFIEQNLSYLLLIVLILVGVLATFTLSTYLQSVADERKALKVDRERKSHVPYMRPFTRWRKHLGIIEVYHSERETWLKWVNIQILNDLEFDDYKHLADFSHYVPVDNKEIGDCPNEDSEDALEALLARRANNEEPVNVVSININAGRNTPQEHRDSYVPDSRHRDNIPCQSSSFGDTTCNNDD